MTASIGVFPDVELEMLYYFVPLFSNYRFVTKMPENVVKPTTRVHRVSGAARNIRVDRPIVDFDTFASDDGSASLTAREIQAALLALRGVTLMNGVVQSVSVINGPRWLPEPNPTLSRFGATYEILIHAL